MAYLLKIKRSAISNFTAVVPKMKSAKLDHSSVGAEVYVWFDDGIEGKSALSAAYTLVRVDETEMPQVRDPSKRKAAYRLFLRTLHDAVVHPLSTDELAPQRYAYAPPGLASLGKIHRDRNDKIIELSTAEANALAARFQS